MIITAFVGISVSTELDFLWKYTLTSFVATLLLSVDVCACVPPPTEKLDKTMFFLRTAKVRNSDVKVFRNVQLNMIASKVTHRLILFYVEFKYHLFVAEQ